MSTKGLVIERVLPWPEVNRECSALAYGCARNAEPDRTMFCVIVIPAIDGLVTPHVQERIRLHEIGHCAGWPADHPGARQSKQQFRPEPHKPWSFPPLSPRQPSTTPPSAVVLCEEFPWGNRMTGTVAWQTEMMVPSPGHPAEMMIRADVEDSGAQTRHDLATSPQHQPEFGGNPYHRIHVLSARRFSFRDVKTAAGVLMKQAERTHGEPLSGSSIKVAPTSF